MTDKIVRFVRAAFKLAFYLMALFLVAGFIAQFLPPKKYPWVLGIWNYTWPITQTVARYVPTVLQGHDLSLLIALALLYSVYLIIERGLWMAADALRPRPVRPKIEMEAMKEVSLKPLSPLPSKNPVYSSEAVVVIDLVNSTNLVTRFGNTFLLMLKHRLEHQVNEICLRNAACYSKSTGDGFLMFFPSLGNGVVALREIFEALPTMNTDLQEGAEIALRAALNFGEVIADRDGDRTGSAVHKTFRLQSLPPENLIESEGGIKQKDFPEKNYILVSEETMPALAKISGLQSRFLGLCEFKGFPGFHRVYQI